MLRWWRPTDDPEITDRVIAFDPDTLARRPVARAEAEADFLAFGRRRAARIVASMPARDDGAIDPDAVDRRLLRVHVEMQRLSEEFQHGQRVAELLRPLLAAIRADDPPRPIRVVDVGCGLGYVIRWLAAHGDLGDDVELLGADHHAALVDEASRLAQAERLTARFVVASVFALREPATVLLSTGVLHHFRGPDLDAFFAQHERPSLRAFVHFDFQRTIFAPPGAWLFHATRFRDPIGRHDGLLSAIRAHPNARLLDAARAAAPGFRSGLYATRVWGTPIPRVFATLVGIRPGDADAFRERLGRRRGRLEGLS